MFDFIKEAFYRMAFFMRMLILGSGYFPTLARSGLTYNYLRSSAQFTISAPSQLMVG